MAYEVNGARVEVDKEGFIIDMSLWNTEVAEVIAAAENILLNDDHWAVVDFLRNYYEKYPIAPSVRVLTRDIKIILGPDKGNSRYLYQLFPDGPVKQASKFAGLPRPSNCI